MLDFHFFVVIPAVVVVVVVVCAVISCIGTEAIQQYLLDITAYTDAEL
jgi:hypothetical protein